MHSKVSGVKALPMSFSGREALGLVQQRLSMIGIVGLCQSTCSSCILAMHGIIFDYLIVHSVLLTVVHVNAAASICLLVNLASGKNAG